MNSTRICRWMMMHTRVSSLHTRRAEVRHARCRAGHERRSQHPTPASSILSQNDDEALFQLYSAASCVLEHTTPSLWIAPSQTGSWFWSVTISIESQAVESQPLLAKRGIAKVLSSTRNELYAPLLSSDEEQERQATEEHSSISAAINAAASLAMDTSPGENTDNIPMSPSPSSHRWVNRFLNMSTAADALPFLLKSIVTNGKTSCIAFLGVYLVLVLLWLPFWLLSKLITEIGVYAFMVVSIVFLGRCIIRLLAFPGSCSRIPAEIETEFASYSVRMIQSSANCVIDFCSAILAITPSGSQATGTLAYYDVPGLWARVKSHRDRVLGMYLDVLANLYREPTAATANSSQTEYGNNVITGDIGNLMGLTPQARSDGKALMALLRKVLTGLDRLEEEVSSILKSASRTTSLRSISEEGRQVTRALLASATELRDIVSSFKPPSSNDREVDGDIDDDEDVSMEAVRQRLEGENESAMDTIKSAGASILPLLDPPPHASIFGLDVLRGSVLSRYRDAKQMWIPRPSGGRLDAMFIPSASAPPDGKRKALMYCNPNAGLIEVATGMSLAGGNIVPPGAKSHPSWVDFYTQHGYDVYLFNYAGFGRSDGRHLFSIGNPTTAPGVIGAIRRIFHFIFFTFKPTPQTLRDDATVVGKHIITEAGYSSLVIHGESIGGLASSGAARALSRSPATKDKLSLLLCDRTFCNLEATAQRLVGGWTGPAIRALAPFWSTDVAGDFLAADCPKLVANDSSDAIIADASSLKAGIALSKEIRRGVSTSRLGWITEAPLTYRMADWENVGVNESKFVKPEFPSRQAPVWPKDKNISLQEAFHFAACVRRIGKVATAEKKNKSSVRSDDEEGFEVNGLSAISEYSSPGEDDGIVVAWKMLACCDGLCGTPLGFSVKNSFDSTVTWLCCTLTLGGQRVAGAAERRLEGSTMVPDVQIAASDFDTRHFGYQEDESDIMIHPKPIPEVVNALKHCLSEDNASIKRVEHELHYSLGVLEYVVARLSSAPAVEASRRSLNLEDSVGAFMDLNCGHNNPFSEMEKDQLREFLAKAATIH